MLQISTTLEASGTGSASRVSPYADVDIVDFYSTPGVQMSLLVVHGNSSVATLMRAIQSESLRLGPARPLGLLL